MVRCGWRVMSRRAVTITVTIMTMPSMTITIKFTICADNLVNHGILLAWSHVVEINAFPKAMINDVAHNVLFHITQMQIRLTQQRSERVHAGLMRQADMIKTQLTHLSQYTLVVRVVVIVM
jgi:hypothetical protein